MNERRQNRDNARTRDRYAHRRRIAFMLVCTFLLQTVPLSAKAADIQYCKNIKVYVDGMEIGEIAAVDDTYENNLYVSLKGVANALADTEKAFLPTVEKRKINIVTAQREEPETQEDGDAESVVPAERTPAFVWSREAQDMALYYTAAKNELYVDGAERKYYSFILSCGGEYDAFLTPVSMAMMFDLHMEVSKGRLDIFPSESFSVTAEEMEESGYLQGVNSLLIGDSTTGEIYYRFDGEEVVPIASTTKLMTYFILMDAVAKGECSLEDTVEISANAASLSVSSDGVTPMVKGRRVSMTDLVYGMLLLSSNECALAIAEHVAGSEDDFVALMNAKAVELGMDNAEFYNCHGLPYFDQQLIPAKLQNHMTAEEMFRMVCVLMECYPQITDFTAVKNYDMNTIGMSARNSNAVLYNLDQTVGLKTGTTNKAGACLVTCIAAEKDGETHYLISVLFGADGDNNRVIVSEMASRYAKAYFEQKKEDRPAENDKVIPVDPELVIQKLIRCAHSEF